MLSDSSSASSLGCKPAQLRGLPVQVALQEVCPLVLMSMLQWRPRTSACGARRSKRWCLTQRSPCST